MNQKKKRNKKKNIVFRNISRKHGTGKAALRQPKHPVVA